jgi:hypothetical protein
MEARRQFVVKLLPSLADFAFLLPIFMVFFRMGGMRSLLGDCDTGWHIRTGEWILAHGQVPRADVFSFTRPGAPWYAWEWLSDVGAAMLYAWGGLRAVAISAIGLISLSMAAVYSLTRRKANAVVALSVTMLAMLNSSIHWLARPHLFTLLFLALFCLGLERIRDGRTRLWRVPVLAIFPLATILWTNLHGGFFVGVLTILGYGAGEMLRWVFGKSGWNECWRRAWPYFASGAGCLAASLVNPYGYQLHVHMAKYLADPFNGQYIVEFLSPNFHHPLALALEALLGLGVVTALWHARNGRYTEGLLILVWTHGALLASRNMPILAIVAAAPMAEAIGQWMEYAAEAGRSWGNRIAAKFNAVAGELTVMERIPRLHLVSAAGLLGVWAVMAAPNPPRAFRPEFDPKSYPAAALAALKSDPQARIFTNDEWGDYLIFTLYPGHKVFVDGRSDFYGDAFEKTFRETYNVTYNWESNLHKFAVNTILLPPDAPLCGALKESRNWQVVYDDGQSLVFRSTDRTGGVQISATASDGGEGRDREVTKTTTGDLAITPTKPKI